MRILFSNYALLDKTGFGRSFMLARELAIIGNKVTFLTGLPSNKFIFPYKKEVRDGVLIIAFPDIVPNFMRRTGFGLLSFVFKLFYVFINKYDIYHADVGHRPCGGIPILLKKQFKDIVYVSEWYNYYGKGGQYDSKKGIKKYTHGAYDLFFEIKDKKIADGVVCLSSAMAERANKEGISEDHLSIINGGADVKSIYFQKHSTNKVKFNIDNSSLTFGFIGMNVGQLKDIMPLIEALNELSLKSEFFKKSTLITTGRFLPKRVKEELDLKFKLKEFGWVDYEVYSEILSCVDIFVLLQEPNLDNRTRWPNRLGDYIAAGRKTLINPYGDTRSLVGKYKELFIEVDFSKETIKRNLAEVIQNEEIYSDREVIRKIAEEELSWNQKAKQLLNFYNKLLYSKRKNEAYK